MPLVDLIVFLTVIATLVGAAIFMFFHIQRHWRELDRLLRARSQERSKFVLTKLDEKEFHELTQRLIAKQVELLGAVGRPKPSPVSPES